VSAPARHIELHRVKTDVLLWALGGFVVPRSSSLQRGHCWDEEQRAALIALVNATARLPSGPLECGALARFAAKFGKSQGSVVQEIHRLKECGRLPWIRRGRAGEAEWKRAA
jgi:hypothetical protein